MRLRTKRRWLAAEVVQTSSMDCGPASLKCLLEGFGVAVSYGRLREACQTDVDGTSIDTLEDVANRLGLDAEQVMVPVDHVLRRSAKALPAIAVVRLPNGVTHFVVVWGRHGQLVQVMDPAVGRRFVPVQELLDRLYVHEMPVPAAAWREWAGGGELLEPLRERHAELGASARHSGRLIATALADPSWIGLGALDAATRMVGSIVEAGGIRRGRAAARLLEALFDQARDAPHDAAGAVPATFWSVRPAPETADGEAQVFLKGAVLVRALGRRSPEAATDGEPLSPELAAALHEKTPHPARHLVRMLAADGVLTPFVLLFALLLTAGGLLAEALLFRGIFEIGSSLGLFGQRLGFVGMLIGLAVTLLLLELPTRAALLRLGRHLEVRLRQAFLEKIPRLGDRYFQSRLTSDMAERSHALHVLRSLPVLVGTVLRSGFGLVLTAMAIAWLDPGSAPYAALAAVTALVLPLLVQPVLSRRDLRWRTHAGALTRFYLDALLGLVAARTHGAEKAIRRDHEGLLVDWTEAGLSVQRAAVAVDGLVALTGYGLAALLLFQHVSAGAQGGAVLLLVYWALNLPVLGQRLALSARQYPSLRNVTLRLLEPLGAPEEPLATARDAAPPTDVTGVHIELDGVSVVAGGQVILQDVRLEVPAGEHIAVVGPSGAGKSSLVGLLLGWHRAAAGQVRVDGQPLDTATLAELRRRTAWVDPAVQLWNRSLLENLRYGLDDGHDAPLVEVLDAADLRRLLDLVPEGLQTALGENGGLVSGGEGQRVRLGRALLRRDARLVILDEPFRGLDRERRRALLDRARRWWQRATFVFITHDVEQATTFPRVIVVESGTVAEDGDPARLAAEPTSRLARLLEAERAVRSDLWTGPQWRRLWLADGRLETRAEAETEDAPPPVGAAGEGRPPRPAAVVSAQDGTSLTWPVAEVSHALQAVVRESGLPAADADLPELAAAAGEPDRLGAWIEAAAQRLGLEAEPVQTTYTDLERFASGAGPALVVLDRAEGPRILALTGQARRGARVLTPQLRVRALPAERVSALLSADADARHASGMDALLEAARVPPRRQGRVRRALLRQQLASSHVVGAWILRMPPGGSFLAQLRQEGLLGWLGGLAGAHAIAFSLFLLSWWLLGRGALGGTLEVGWLLGWALVLLSAVPFQMLATWCQGMFALGASGLMKRRLLLGALRLEPEQIRHQGSGQLLGRVIESEALESMALSGGFLALTSAVDLLAAALVLGAGAAGALHVVLLALWLALTLLVTRRQVRARAGWTDARLGITNDLVERMVGHRTRLAQEAPQRWHEGEDRALESYLTASRRMDTLTVALQAVVARGWTIAGLLALVPAFLAGSATPTALAISVGGLILAYRALESAASSMTELAGAGIAWGRVADLFRTAARREAVAPDLSLTRRSRPAPGAPLLEASDLVFGYPGRPRPILSGASLTIRHGDRVLLEGPSGGGKSTLASLLVGLRRPQSGLLLLHGLDRHTLGPQGWRSYVTAAPQFHENHVFTETFAFNLLMGRRWPAPPEDFAEAEGLCRELGLGPLLERMPSGLLQIVGETGWQLSHGERSRLFLARALLQRTDLVVLDESFAALDPENLELALRCVLERAPTLVVIAHP